MKHFFLFIALLSWSFGYSQTMPIDFETGVTTSNFVDFDGGVGTVIPNPQITGTNTSATVGQIVRTGGAIWAGSKIVLSGNVDFSTLGYLSMQVYTTAPIGTMVKFKLEGTGAPAEVDAWTTTTGAWETLIWDFTGTPNDLNTLVFMFDFGNVGNGSATSTFLFDDVQQIVGPPPAVPTALPVDFEMAAQSVSMFSDFNGGTASVILNPQMSGINVSDTVGQIVRDGGALWAGSKIALSSNLDFSTTGLISMNVFTTAPVGTTVKFKLEGSGAPTEVDALTTVSGAWEELTFDFTGQPNTFNWMVLMFDFGNLGDGSATSTFLFDNIMQGVAPPPPAAINLPIDFETGVMNSHFDDFDGGVGTVILNPQMNGTNLSDTVGQIVRNGGAIWAGSKLELGTNIDFSSLGYISMKVFTTAPVGTMVKFKLEGSGAPTEVDAWTTTSGAWETLIWDFTGTPNDLNTLVFMFDFGNVGNGSATSTFLFDDIEQIVGPAPAVPTALPVEFETASQSIAIFDDFDGGTASTILNPQMNGLNLSDSVGQIIRDGGAVWAGSRIALSSNLDFTTTGLISMKVFSTAPVGTTVKFKLEGSGAPTEVDALTTVSGAWEELTFDFTGQPNTFNWLVLMFDFGNLGDGSATSTFLFDDIMQGLAPPPPAAINLPIDFETGVTTAHFDDFDGGIGTVILNPQMNGTNLSDTVGQIVRNGGAIWAGSKLELGTNIDFSSLGYISMKLFTTAPVGTMVKFKLEGTGAPVEVDAWTTTTGAWETLIWDFTGTPNDLNTLVFMFDFGNVGNGSATSTFLFDDIEQVVGPAPAVPTALPVEFETSSQSIAVFDDFDGGTASVILNPQMNGLNLSDSVGQIIRNGGAVWAGSRIALSSNIDFSTQGLISMKVFTTAPVGTTVKFKLEGSGAPTEVDALTTVSGAWETLVFDFTGQPNTFNWLVLMFDFGNLGDGSATSTFLFDDIFQGLAPPPTAGFDLPIDFEIEVNTNDFDDFDGGVGTVILNPQQNAQNLSDSVGQIIRNGGQIWAGSKLELDNDIDFSTLGYISMKVYTTAPAGTMVKFKLEGTGAPAEVDAWTTTSGAWETLIWDFTGTPTDLNTLVFMFDFGNLGDSSATSTFLFDDIEQIVGPAPAVPTNLPVEFETASQSIAVFDDFDGGVATVIANPQMSGINLTDSVGQIIRTGGALWAGSRIALASNIDFTTEGLISMKVFTTAPVGTTVKFKLEGTSAPTEVDVLTTVSGAWETLVFDFTGQPNDFNWLVLMFDFGNLGDGSATSTFLFDDIMQGVAPPPTAGFDLPIDFEIEVSSSDFMDFDGGYGTVIANPQQSGINLSDSVGRIIRSGGQIWAGSSLELENNVDFSTLGYISMKVFTTAPAGTTVKFKLEGTGAPVEMDAFTTQSGAWETLTWNFTGTPTDLNTLVFMFDYNNLGDSTATSTFLFDDIMQVAGPDPAVPTDLPIEFESAAQNVSIFENFDGGVASVIANPQVNGINLSDTVGQIVRTGGAVWAGSKIALANNIDFSTQGLISMKVFTTAPVGTTVKFKLEGSGAPTEVDAVTTVSGAWEQLTFDFTGQPNTFNWLVLMFDFGNLGDGSAASTFLFDDIMQVTPTVNPNLFNLPINFEDDVISSDFSNFDGGTGIVMPNLQVTLDNLSDSVGQIVRDGGEIWGGSSLTLENNLDFSTLHHISMKVFTNAPVGTTVKLKLEGTGAPVEVDVPTTVSGDWETLLWNFSGTPNDLNTLVFMFDYGNVGDGSATSTFLFDDIMQTAETGIKDQIGSSERITAFPNPTKNQWTLSASESKMNFIVVVDVLGNRVMQLNPNSPMTTVDASSLAPGIYFARIQSDAGMKTVKLVKD